MRSWVDSMAWPAMPATRLAALRLLVGIYAAIFLLIRLPHLWGFTDLPAAAFAPVGVASWLHAPPPAWLARLSLLALFPLSWAFLAGYRHRWISPVFAFLLLWELTLANSFGKILHTDNLLVLYVGVLAVAPAADAYALDARGRPAPGANGRYGWAPRLMAAICVAVYLLAGVAKLRSAGVHFFDGDTLRNYVAFSNVRKIELGSHHSPLAAWLLPHAWLFSALAAFSLALELLAPFALLGRRLGRIWAVAIWGFHLGVLALMAIGFFFQLTFVAFSPFFEPERWIEGLARTPLAKKIFRVGHFSLAPSGELRHKDS